MEQAAFVSPRVVFSRILFIANAHSFTVDLAMYGLVNIAIEQLITDQFGQEAWQRIAQKANVSPFGFVSMEAYDDSITYTLVEAASVELDMEPKTILEAFGEYWILYTAREGYGELLELSGQTFEEFLRNLDNMHTRVALSYPELKPPSFRCERRDDGALNLHYFSHRKHLEPMVRGLLQGLAKRFGIRISVQHETTKPPKDAHSVFTIRILN